MRSHYADSRTKDAPWKKNKVVLPVNNNQKIKHNIQSIDTTVKKEGKFKVFTESECLKVMKVLRQTNTEASKLTLKHRMIEKQKEKNIKKFTNVNNLKKALVTEKNKNSLRNKIKLMRKQKIFPQPVGPTDYRKQYGMLEKIVIK